jgi:predicted nucleic acid-binding protein
VAYYLDTSAYLKLVVRETESDALLAWVRSESAVLVASDLMRVEALRTARRHSPAALREARSRLAAVTLVSMTADICDRACDLDPSILRSLDAVHLATALSIGDAMQGVVTYDERLAEACAAHGVVVFAPS